MEYKILNKYRNGRQAISAVFSVVLKHPNPNFLNQQIHVLDAIPTSTHRGVATLPMVMVLGVLALVVAVSATTLSFTELMISQGSGQSSRAQSYAESGARDALIKIGRNKSYLCATTDCYTIDFSTGGCASGSDCAKVQVTGNDTTKTVISKGIMKSSTRALQVIVGLNTYGQITSAVWSEVTN